MVKKLKCHLFVCTNAPQTEGKCGHKNAEALRRQLKEKCKNESWAAEVRVNSAGCLGQCELGIAAVIYPQAEWITGLNENDGDQLYSAIKSSLGINK